MPSNSDNRLGWNHEIDSFAKTFMMKMSRHIDKWARQISERKGLIVDKVDKRIKEAEERIQILGAIFENLKKEEFKLDELSRKKVKEAKRYIDEAARYKVPANKYRVEKDNLEKLKPGTAAYKEQEERLKQFEPKYKKWLELVAKAEDAQKEAHKLSQQKIKIHKKREKVRYNGKEYTPQTLASEKRHQLQYLKRDKELLEGALSRNMEKHRAELVNAFRNPKYISKVAGMISNTMNQELNGALRYTDELSENEIFQLMEEVFKIVYNDDPERFNPFKVLVKNKKHYTELPVGEKVIKIFDMDKIPIDDFMTVFSSWLRLSIRNVTLNTIKKLSTKRDIFIPEQQETDDDETVSLYDRVVKDTTVPEDRSKRKRKTRGITDENIVKNNTAQNYWTGLESFLYRNIDNITKTVNNALQKQLPPKSYYRRIGEQQAFKELKVAMQKIIRDCSSQLRHGDVAFNRLRDFTKMAIGGVEDMEVFNLIYTVVRAALEYYVVSKMGSNILEDVKGLTKEESSHEMKLLQLLNQKRSISEKALRDYRTVKYANRSYKVANNIVDQENFEDPEEAARKLIKATQQMEDKVDFLLEDIPVTDGSGKHNEFVNTRPIRNTGDYGA